MRKLIFILLLIIPISSYSIDRSLYYSFGEKFEATLFSVKKGQDSIRTYIIFKIMNDHLNFVKKEDNSMNDIYTSNPEIEIIAKDDRGVIRKRQLWKEQISVNGYYNTVSKKEFIYGYKELDLELSNYTIGLELLGMRDKRINNIELNVNKNDIETIGGSPIFISSQNDGKFGLEPHVMSNAYAFHSQDPVLLIPTTRTDNDIDIKIKKIRSEQKSKSNRDKKFIMFQDQDLELKLGSEIIKSHTLNPRVRDNKVTIDLLSSGDLNFYMIKMPVKDILPGRYSLTISSLNYRFDFDVNWEDKPLALDDIDFAIEKMYYILDDNAFEEMNDGSDQRRFEKFMFYWNKKDPTPETPFNEAMVQYFERVDFAFFNFQTLPEKDGAATDRGKIYILNGPPDIIENTTNEGKSRIIWTYSKFKEKYIFDAIQTGVFRLVKVDKNES